MITPEFLAEHSTYIENVMRHRLVYDISSWLLLQRPEPETVSVLRSEVDDAGIDIVLTYRKITRQLQLKTLAKSTTANSYAIAESLGGISGGGVVWLCYDRLNLNPTRYHFFGSRGNEPLRDLSGFPEATRKKNGKKIPRPGYRWIKIAHAEHRNIDLGTLVQILFDV